MKKIIPYLLTVTLCTLGFAATAQDLHFSQFFNSPLSTNPANTGFIPDGDYRVGVNYRNQWASIPVPYKTMSAFGDAQLFKDRLEYGWVGVGGMILHDVAGTGNLTSTKVYGSIAYHQLLGFSSLLSAGFNVGWANKRVDITKLTFGDQWNGQFFDSQIPTAEPFAQNNINYLDIQVGMNYAYFPNENVYVNGGFSVHHVNKPQETFYNNNNQIDRRYIGFLNASIKLSDMVIINPGGYYSQQAKASEVVIGGNAAYNLSGDGAQQLFGGLYYRFNDAAIFLVGYQVKNVKMMFNYDVTTSQFSSSNRRQGAYEIGIIYTGLYPNLQFRNAARKTLCPSF